MVSSNNRTLLIFSAVIIILLILASICVIAGIMLLSPVIKEQMSYPSDSANDTGGNIFGRTLAYISCPADHTVRAVDPSTRRVVAMLRLGAAPSLAIPCPDGDLYVAAGSDLYVIDFNDMKTIRNVTYPGPIHRMAFSPDGGRAYVEYDGGDGARISVLDTGSYVSIGNVTDMPNSPENDMAASPDGKYLYVTNYDIKTNASSLAISDSATGITLKNTPIAPDPVYMRITPDGRYLFICFDNDPVEVVNTKTLWVEGNLGFVGHSVEFSR